MVLHAGCPRDNEVVHATRGGTTHSLGHTSLPTQKTSYKVIQSVAKGIKRKYARPVSWLTSFHVAVFFNVFLSKKIFDI